MNVTAGGPAVGLDAGPVAGPQVEAVVEPGPGLHAGLQAAGIEEGSSEARILGALVRCAARWGMPKTTVDDVAREAGLSRATVYRLFPGGKASIARLAARVETIGALADIRSRLRAADGLEDAMVVLLADGSAAIEGHPALAYMRDHDPAAIRAFLSLSRVELLLDTVGDGLGPELGRFLAPAEARAAAVWAARIVVSHYRRPREGRPLSDPEVARRLARTYVLPGLAPARTSDPA